MGGKSIPKYDYILRKMKVYVNNQNRSEIKIACIVNSELKFLTKGTPHFHGGLKNPTKFPVGLVGKPA